MFRTWILSAEREGHLLDLSIQPGDHHLQMVDVIQMRSGQDRVMSGEPTGQRHRQVRDLRSHQPRARSANTRGSRCPAINASIMSRADLVFWLDATESILMPASSQTLPVD